MTWTRLLSLRLGHTTAAASTVVAAFMGGLALGAALAGWAAPRLAPRRALQLYAFIECLVVLIALTLPLQLDALTPVLRGAYHDGDGGALFTAMPIATAFGVLLPPALALGASFPLAARWREASQAGPGPLYAVNTCGAAGGAAGAGFMLLPMLGLRGSTFFGMALTLAAIGVALLLARDTAPHDGRDGEVPPAPQPVRDAPRGRARAGRSLKPHAAPTTDADAPRWLAPLVAAVTGFAGFTLEIAWTRVFALVAGPSTYAFAAVLTCFIGGLAGGAVMGASLAVRSVRRGRGLAVVLGSTALLSAWATWVAGSVLPAAIALDLAASHDTYLALLTRHALWLAGLLVPVTVALGMTFPLLLALAGGGATHTSRSAAVVYGVNTLAGVAGSLLAGFLLLPALGIQGILHLATTLLAVSALAALLLSPSTIAARLVPAALAVAALLAVGLHSPWDRALLASGAYKYAPFLPAGADARAMLTAGTLRYDRDGATSTVAVRELTGIRSLAIDGKIDASSGADMATQKMLAHLPLLLHPQPRRVAVIGLGSGVTAGAALTHPVEQVDVLEISPEVVAASALFADENRHALDDRRTRLIVGDGRSHLLLSGARYDVIVSEPSNPWMAGVASLFTREFFEAARARLAPGGVLCQWAHIYDISPDDLRSIVATFRAVFPEGTMWLVGEGDLLLVGADGPLGPRIDAMVHTWTRPGVADDLSRIGATTLFTVASAYIGGPAELAAFSAGAQVQADDTMALEYSGPRAVNSDARERNRAALAQLRAGVSVSADVDRRAQPSDWRARGTMMLAAEAFDTAYRDFDRALTLDPSDVEAARGYVRAAVAAGREQPAVSRLQAIAAGHPQAAAPRIALSMLFAGTGQPDAAVQAAVSACTAGQPAAPAFEQAASVYADAGDLRNLTGVVDTMQALFPDDRATAYYSAVVRFMSGDLGSALGLAQRAISIDARYAAAHNLLGAVHASEGRRDAAREAFLRAQALDRRDVSVYANLARLELAGGNRTAAARWFTEALTLDPDSDAIRLELAQLGAR